MPRPIIVSVYEHWNSVHCLLLGNRLTVLNERSFRPLRRLPRRQVNYANWGLIEESQFLTERLCFVFCHHVLSIHPIERIYPDRSPPTLPVPTSGNVLTLVNSTCTWRRASSQISQKAERSRRSPVAVSPWIAHRDVHRHWPVHGLLTLRGSPLRSSIAVLRFLRKLPRTSHCRLPRHRLR